MEEKYEMIKTVTSGVIGMLFGVMFTYITGVASNSQEIAVLDTKVNTLIGAVSVKMTDRYTGNDHESYNRTHLELHNIQKQRFQSIEHHVEIIESDIKQHQKIDHRN